MVSVLLPRARLAALTSLVALGLSACANMPFIGANRGERLPSETSAPPALTAAAPVAPARGGKPAPPVSAEVKFSSNTKVGVLLDNPATRQVLQRHCPGVVTSPQIGMARGLPLKQLAGFPDAHITPQQLADIDRELARVR